MAFSQIADVAPNYRDYGGWWLKAYTPGTTTPKVMSDNSTGSPQAAKYEINVDGFIVSSGSALIIPFIDGDYDLYLFPTEAEADDNDTSNALRLADDIAAAQSINNKISYSFSSVSNLKAGTTGGEDITDELKELIDSGDVAALTLGYYGTYSDSETPSGGANYILTTLARARAEKGGSWVPDTYGDHYLFGGTEYVAVLNESRLYMAYFGVLSDGSAETTLAAQAAVDYAYNNGKTEITAEAGTFELDNLEMRAGVTIKGFGSSGYASSVTNSTTVFKRSSSATCVLVWNEDSSGLLDLDIDGNGGRLAASGDGVKLLGSNYGHLERVKVLDCNYGFSGDTSTPPGSFDFLNVTVRQNNQGIRAFRDTTWIGCTVSANYVRGIYLNQGQNKFLDGWIEFQRDQDNSTLGVANKAEGIYLDSNVSEFIVDGTHFDRNAGNSIFIQDGAQRITIGGANQFKGCAWGGDLTTSQRYSIRVNGAADVLNLSSGIMTENRNQGPSTEVGPYSPIGFADLGSSTRVNVGLTNHTDLANAFNLNSKDLIWALSSSGTSEYYLKLDTTTTVSPITEPDYIAEAFASLTQATVGALSTSEWAWGDNDSLGYNTVYVRTSGSVDPTGVDVHAFYDLEFVDDLDCVDIQTTDNLDSLQNKRVAASTTETYSLKTRDLLTSTQLAKSYSVVISGDQQTSSQTFSYKLNFILRRASTPSVTVIEGEVQELESGGVTARVGWETTATDEIRVAIEAGVLGGDVSVAINNLDATRFADVSVTLRAN